MFWVVLGLRHTCTDRHVRIDMRTCKGRNRHVHMSPGKHACLQGDEYVQRGDGREARSLSLRRALPRAPCAPTDLNRAAAQAVCRWRPRSEKRGRFAYACLTYVQSK